MTVLECLIAFIFMPLAAFSSVLLIGMLNNRALARDRAEWLAQQRKALRKAQGLASGDAL